MEKVIKIDGRDVPFKATAITMKLYRAKFKRDLLGDFNKLNSATQKGEALTEQDLQIFENLAYTMAKQADPTIPADPDEWLDSFNMFSIWEVLPEISELFGISLEPIAELKKNKKPN